MIYSLLSNENYKYIKLHVEQAYTEVNIEKIDNISNFNSEIFETKGFYSKKLTYSVVDKISKNIDELSMNCKRIYLDFYNLSEFQDNIVGFIEKWIAKLKMRDIEVIFLNLETRVYDYFEEIIIDMIDIGYPIVQLYDLISKRYSFAVTEDANIYLTNYSSLFENLYIDEFEKNLINCTKVNDHNEAKHTSSPVYLSKYIDVKELILNKQLFLLSVYKLVEKMVEDKMVQRELKKNRNTILFFHTLNGASIATVISMLLGLDMIYLDHIGPINKVYKNNFEHNIRKDKNYIVISDVICLRTEIQIAKNLIGFLGGKCIGNISFVEVEVIKDESLYEMSTPLYTLKKENNIIDYTIETEFSD